MNEWQPRSLGEALDVHHGWTFKGEFFAESGELIILTPGNFKDAGGFKSKNGAEKFYKGAFPDKYLLPEGAVVIAMTEQAQGLLGSTATIPEPDRYLHNQRIGLLEVTDPAVLDLRFVYHLMNAPDVRRQIQATATGSKVRHTAPRRIRDVVVPLPAVPTQRAIAGILDAFDELIENNRRRVEVLEEMARAIYREWFVKFRYPGHGDVPLVDSVLGPIPHGWSIAVVDDLLTVVKASVDPTTIDPNTPAVGLEHIPRQQITLDDWGFAGAQGSRKGLFERGDVLFGKIRPYFHKVSVAPVDGICSTDAIVIRPQETHWGQVVAVVSSADFVAHATSTSNGTKMPRADWKVIGQWPVVVPPANLAEAFTAILKEQLGMAEKLMLENRSVAALRDLLLPKLVTGQIDVSSLDLEALAEGAVA